jgi:hypothetical protein
MLLTNPMRLRMVILVCSVLAAMCFVCGFATGLFLPKTSVLERPDPMPDIILLEFGLQGYKAHYKHFPKSHTATSDVWMDTSRDSGLVPALTGAKCKLNPDGAVFMVSGRVPRGALELLDPWGNPYQVVVDADADSACDTAEFGRIPGYAVVVWSPGSGPCRSWLR